MEMEKPKAKFNKIQQTNFSPYAFWIQCETLGRKLASNFFKNRLKRCCSSPLSETKGTNELWKSYLNSNHIKVGEVAQGTKPIAL
jgi:hypothetical protein